MNPAPTKLLWLWLRSAFDFGFYSQAMKATVMNFENKEKN